MADNRENTLLQAIAEGNEVSEARTADETFLKAIADGAEKPEEIRNRLQYWLSQISGGGGGLSVTTYEAETADVFITAQLSADEIEAIHTKMLAHQAFMTLECPSLALPEIAVTADKAGFVAAFSPVDPTNDVYVFAYYVNGDYSQAFHAYGTNSFTKYDYIDAQPITIKIYEL